MTFSDRPARGLARRFPAACRRVRAGMLGAGLAAICVLDAGGAGAEPFDDVEAGGSCGGSFSMGRCAPGLFCESRLPGCQAFDWAGKCVAVPAECPATEEPVCGCDHQTYRNDCERQRAKAQSAHSGPCTPPGR